MGFPKEKAGSDGLNKAFGNAIPEDSTSNINWQKSSQRIGTVNGKVKFGTSSVADLNTGCPTCRDDDCC